jgi:hypothetical protein
MKEVKKEYIYAKISNGIVVGISQLSGEIDDSSSIRISEYDTLLLGKVWNGDKIKPKFDDNPDNKNIDLMISLEYLRKGILSFEEKVAIDNYESNKEISDIDMMELRTRMKDLLSGTMINLSNKEELELLYLWEKLGFIKKGRTGKIISFVKEMKITNKEKK